LQGNTDLLRILSGIQRKFSEPLPTDNLADWLTIIADAFDLPFVEICEQTDGHFVQVSSARRLRGQQPNEEPVPGLEAARQRTIQSNTVQIIDVHSIDGMTSYACFPVSLLGKSACLGVMSRVQITPDLQMALMIAAGQISTSFELSAQKKSIAATNAEAEENEYALRELTARLTDRVESERRRLSRELHDQAGQSLTAILIRLDLISDKIADESIRQQLKQIESLAEDTINEIRRVSRDLRPAVLDDLGLEEALEGLASALSGGALSINLIIEKPFPRMPEAIETALYRITQEALNNVIKHAGATVVAVRLQHDTDQVQLEIKDNGSGIDLEIKDSNDGIGLLGMKERADSLGGKLLIESQPGSGTRVKVEIPL